MLLSPRYVYTYGQPYLNGTRKSAAHDKTSFAWLLLGMSSRLGKGRALAHKSCFTTQAKSGHPRSHLQKLPCPSTTCQQGTSVELPPDSGRALHKMPCCFVLLRPITAPYCPARRR